MALKYAKVPVVAAVQGMALGGGCEFLMHAAKRVIALESYIGLVEAGVGLIPAGGGCKEFAIRAAQHAAKTGGNDPFEFIQPVFMTIAMATYRRVARRPGNLASPSTRTRSSSTPTSCSMWRCARHADLPRRAITRACRRADQGRRSHRYRQLRNDAANMKEGGMISAHDYVVAKAAATALCGGDIETGSLVDEQWLLSVERQLFVELLKNEKTQQRIQHMLETGKPLRN
jgi:3-hydroxyacyl-CoA dehydrogenase